MHDQDLQKFHYFFNYNNKFIIKFNLKWWLIFTTSWKKKTALMITK